MHNEHVQEEQHIMAERTQPATPFEDRVLCKRIDEVPEVSPVVAVELGTSVRHTVETMAQEQVDGVLVLQDGALVGVCTTRDVVLTMAAGSIDMERLRVDDCMQPKPTCLQPQDDLAYAINQMFVSDS